MNQKVAICSQEVIIYWKDIQFDVVFPTEEEVWPFAMAFGKKFAVEDTLIGGKPPKPIDEYFWQGGYHVKVSVPVSEEQQFYDFLRRFCEEQDLPVREEDLKPGH